MKIYDAGSFRDPSGKIFYYENNIFREIFLSGLDKYNFLKKDKLLDELVEKNFLVKTEEIKTEDVSKLKPEDKSIIIKHEKINFISYPYEWTFNELKDAAIFHLDLQLFLLEKGAKLIDASAYNIQFKKLKPIFIDVLSIDKYKEGEFWGAHKQFCENFLNPLILTSKTGINFNNWFKGNLEGITTSDLYSVLKLKHFLSPTIFFQVFLLNKIEQKATKNPLLTNKKINKAKGLSKNAFKFMLTGLKSFIKKLELKNQITTWEKYSEKNTYSEDEDKKKMDAVESFLKKNKSINLLADLGCNDGKFSRLAIKSNIENVIGFDFDLKVLDRSYLISKKNNQNILPLYLDFTNPSSNLGWNDNERKSFNKRAKFDCILALALIHHLVLAKNIPLNQTLIWLTSMAPAGLIEFVPKEDPTSQFMLSLKGDIFPDYNEENFKKELSRIVKIKNITTVSNTGRKIYEFIPL